MSPEVGSWDVVLLEDLNEDSLISNLSQRYKWDQTYVGSYLIFLNPHKRLVLCSNDAINLYAQRSLFKLPPHVYALANAAYENLKNLNEEQCVILTGESGSGKTESSKLVVDYLTKISQWRRYNCLQPRYRSTTSLGSNRSINSNGSSRTATPSHTPSCGGGGPSGTSSRRIIRARSTEYEPNQVAAALNYGSLKKCGHERKTVEFDLSTKYKSTENLINHHRMLQTVSPTTTTVPKCQLHFPVAVAASSSSSSSGPTYHHRHHLATTTSGAAGGTMKKCPKHNPEAKSIMVKCDPHFKRSAGDLHSPATILNPHCRVHAKQPSVTQGTATTTSILKLTANNNPNALVCDKEPKANLARTMAGTPPRSRRAKTPPPTLHFQQPQTTTTTSPAALLRHRHSHHEATMTGTILPLKLSNEIRTALSRSLARGKTPEEIELDVIAERVHQAEVFLNAMGHASTTRNANSSRFGKFFDIQIDFKGDIIGAHLTQYMLEKARVTKSKRGERNFHVFYQLLSGADVQFLKVLKLHRNVDKYELLRNTFSTDEDKQCFASTKSSLDKLGFSAEEILSVFRILAVILKLGNLSFLPITNIDGTEGCSVSNDFELLEIAQLLDIDSEILLMALTRGDVEFGMEYANADICNWTELDAIHATINKSLLCRTMYGRLFTWMVNRINEALKPKQYSQKKNFGILDFYGFENLDNNSFEQLAINYCNERIHQNFVVNVLRYQQELYVREGLEWTRIDYFDNESICDLIDRTNFGILKLLDETQITNDVILANRLQQCCSGHPNFDALLAEDGGIRDYFQVRHFAGSVNYDIHGFLEKNMDLLPRSISAGLYRSNSQIVQTLFPEGNPKRVSKRPTSNGGTLRIAVQTLLQTMDGRRPNYVFCVRPNEESMPGAFDVALVQHQVRYMNLMPLVRLCRTGFCYNMFHVKFFYRYKMLSRVTWPTFPNGSLIEGIAIIIENLPLPVAEFVITRKRVFIRSPRTLFELEELRKDRLDELAVMIQTTFRCYWHRKRFLKMRQSQTIIASAWRTWRAREEYRVMKYRKQVEWAVAVIQRQYIQWKKRQFLVMLPLRMPSNVMSPSCVEWPTVPSFLAETSLLLRNIHHRWKCYIYRKSFDQTARNRMREKVTASIIFKERKAIYARSVSHPFSGDYVRLRQNVQWKKISMENNDQYVVFADIINKITRSSGKFVPILLVLSTSSMLLLDQRTLQIKYRVPASEIYRLSLSPFMDDVAVFHVRASEVNRKKGDFVFQTCHVIEIVTKLFLVIQNATAKPPEIHISPEFEANFHNQTVIFSFKCVGLPETRVCRRGNRMEIVV